MRVGFQVTCNGRPVAGASIVPALPLTTGFPFVPVAPVTGAGGEWFGVAPLAVSPASPKPGEDMRVGFQVTSNGRPVEGARIVPWLPLTSGFPFFPALPVTDRKGEWFGVAPLAISPALYLMDVSVQGRGRQVRISGAFDEIENRFLVDLAAGTWRRERLGARIPGDGYWEPDPRLLREAELIDVSGDPVRAVSNCSTCVYLFPPGAPRGQCLVNGIQTDPIPIEDAPNTSSRKYYPFFLHPVSLGRLALDARRLWPS